MIEISKINSGLIERLEHENRIIIKTLDQVQGEEADIVFISFGYGKNKDHKFEMRFGPVNLNGGDKRLNVLFSRAKKELHFFSSVKYHDFKKTDNAGVKTLINWFAYIENINYLSKNQKSNGHISFFELMNNSPSSHDFIHLIKIHHLRGWSFSFD